MRKKLKKTNYHKNYPFKMILLKRKNPILLRKDTLPSDILITLKKFRKK